MYVSRAQDTHLDAQNTNTVLTYYYKIKKVERFLRQIHDSLDSEEVFAPFGKEENQDAREVI